MLPSCLSFIRVCIYLRVYIVDESFEQRRRGSLEQTRSRPLTDVSHDDLIYTTYEKPCLPRARYIFNTLHPITITALKRVLSRFPFRYVNSLSTFFTEIRKSYTCCLAKTRVEVDSLAFCVRSYESFDIPWNLIFLYSSMFYRSIAIEYNKSARE